MRKETEQEMNEPEEMMNENEYQLLYTKNATKKLKYYLQKRSTAAQQLQMYHTDMGYKIFPNILYERRATTICGENSR
jgi:hypothetical protein